MVLRRIAYYVRYSYSFLVALARRRIDSILEGMLLRHGKEVEATITSCTSAEDPADDEHTIFEIEFEYVMNRRKIKKGTSFSINTAHIEYAHLGQLFDVPELEYSLDDFKKSLEPGNKIDIVASGKWPFHYVNRFNAISREVMRIPQVWS